jgi:hypothetical protein
MLVLATMEKLAGTVPTLQFFCYPAKDLQVKISVTLFSEEK